MTAAGELLLVTIEGRDPALSVGATLPEAAEVMKWLGAEDAVGMGSGGDTTLVAKDALQPAGGRLGRPAARAADEQRRGHRREAVNDRS
ncbi:phosphodiester glycosidase family protein [Streptomyces sp. NPDC089173]|uniref:phosphodiester glycosidase family protein n=1 Tax=Streptomyces sp. NPDC089173 TaxID=3154965 RepID=UPI00344C976D